MERSPLDRIIGFFLCVVIVLRITIQSGILNRFVGYTSGQGSVIGRFHPGTYLLVIPIVLYVLRGRIRAFPLLDIPIVLLVAAAVVALGNGGLNAASIIVDTDLSALVIARLMVANTPEVRATVFNWLVALALINLPLVVFEKATGITLFALARNEQFFRPQGLFDHPLSVGSLCCFVMWAVLRSPMRRPRAVLVNFCLLLEIVLCSVRLPLLVASVLFLLTLVSLGGRSLGARLGAASFAAVLAPALVAAAASLGLLDRFIDLGLFDDSSAGSRVQAWALLGQLHEQGFWHGLSNDAVDALLATNHMEVIENSFVAFVLLCGIVVAMLVHVAVLLATAMSWIRDPAYLLILVAALFGGLALSVKTPVVLVALAVVAIQYRGGLAALPAPDDAAL